MQEQPGSVDGLTAPEVLRLLSAGASGAILMALGEQPLRTKELTGRVRGYTPRTVYRYAAKLVEVGVVERREEPGVPSKVEHRLTDPRGRELYELVDAYAEVALTRLPNWEIDAHAWGSMGLLADLWESGLIRALNLGPQTPTEMSRVDHGLSYHQVNRRASLFAIGGLLEETSEPTRRRTYALTEKTRRGMALIAGIGRWRRRHVVARGSGLQANEAADLLRTVLPLVALPGHKGKSFELRVRPVLEGEEEQVWATVAADGRVSGSSSAPRKELDATGAGAVPSWVDSVLDGGRDGLDLQGDAGLIDDCLREVHIALWKPGAGEADSQSESTSPVPVA